ncbi:hypothetical protein NORO109296_26260 [Nocardiopsis rhodophaea]
MVSRADDAARVKTLFMWSRFRDSFYRRLVRRADALFELCDVLRCADGPVASLPDLALTAEHRRGHGAMYDAHVRQHRPCPAPEPGRAPAAPGG